MPESPEGTLVRLVDVTESDLPLLDRLRATQVGGFNDLGQERRMLPPGAWVDGRLRGDVLYARLRSDP